MPRIEIQLLAASPVLHEIYGTGAEVAVKWILVQGCKTKGSFEFALLSLLIPPSHQEKPDTEPYLAAHHIILSHARAALGTLKWGVL